jgi:hypothetical protein
MTQVLPQGQESRIYKYLTTIHSINVSLRNMEAINVLMLAQVTFADAS